MSKTGLSDRLLGNYFTDEICTRPDYRRGEVRQFLHDNALMWFEEYQVDSLRWDATAYIRNVHYYTSL